MKKIALALLLVLVSTAQPFNGYKLLDKIGSCVDLVVAKGQVSDEDEKLFAEVAALLGLESRDMKIRNSGLSQRLMVGYNATFTAPIANRFFCNATFFKDLSREEKKFLIAYALLLNGKGLLSLHRGALEADALAISQADVAIEDGIRCLEKLYHPDTTSWPMYAKMLERVRQAHIYLFSLPVLKYFTSRPPLRKRVEHLQRLA